MDSKLVVEQMAGRWKIKHPGLRPLAERARALAGRVTRWTWVPRDRNTEADRLLNQALDGTAGRPPASGPTARIDPDAEAPGTTTLLLIAANDPAQAKEVADRVAAQHRVAAVVSPRLPPARELGQVVADRLGVPLVEDEDPAQAQDRILHDYRGQTVATVAPPEFVATFVGSALEVPVSFRSRIQPEPGSVTVLCYDVDGTPALRQLAAVR